MNWLLKLIWMLLVTIQVESGIVPDESFLHETKTYAQQSSSQSQSVIFPSNQNYNDGNQQLGNSNSYASQQLSNSNGYANQQLGNSDVYGNPTLQNPQNYMAVSAATPQRNFANQQQSLTQQDYTKSKQVQDDSVAYQSQYNTNVNRASDPSTGNQPSYTTAQQILTTENIFQNAPLSHDQNVYNSQTNSREAYNSDQKKGQLNKGNSEDVTKIYPYPALDLVDTKTKSSKKIPLVLITIQKNKNSYTGEKSKTTTKKQSSDADTKDYVPHNFNTPRAPEKTISNPILNAGTSGNNVQNSYERGSGEVQNNVQIYAGNRQPQFDQQPQQAPTQNSPTNQRYNGQQIPYRYPILAGKKVESSEWKPVGRNGIRVSGNRNTVSGYSQSFNNEQSHLTQTQNRNFGSSPSYASNSNPLQSPSQSATSNFNGNTQSSQHEQNTQVTNVPRDESNGNKRGKTNYQVTSTFVRQADINFDDSTGYRSASATNIANSPKYFGSNNIQGIKIDLPQQTRVSDSPSQVNFKNDQFSVQRNNNKNTGEIYQDQRQVNSYQSEGNRAAFSYGVNGKRGQSSTTGNMDRSNTDINYNQPAAQDSTNYAPHLQRNVNRHAVTSTASSNNLGAKNNQLHLSSNNQGYSGQNTQPSLTAANFARGNTEASKNDGKFEQKDYTSNAFGTQTQNNFRSFSPSQTPISVALEENKNIVLSQSANYGSNQQLESQTNVKSHQQRDERYPQNTYNTVSPNNQQNTYNTVSPNNQQNTYNTVSPNNQQNTYNTVSPNNQQNTYNTVSPNNQQNIPIQGNSFQSSVKTRSESSQNYPQTENRNNLPAIQNYASNQGNRNNIIQNADNFASSNNRQNNASPNQYHSVTVGYNAQFSKEPANSEVTSFNLKKDTAFTNNPEQQSVANNYRYNVNQDAVNYGNVRDLQSSVNSKSNSNKESNTGYDNAQGRGTFQENNSFGRNLNPLANVQNNQQNVFHSSNRFQENNYDKTTSPNYGFPSNNYQNTNYGSSESQESIVGTKPEGKTAYEVQRINNDQNVPYRDNYERPNEENKYQNGDRSVEQSNNEAISKEVNDEEDADSSPEALLLVLVSAKKSALENQDEEEKDEMNEGYESAPEELVDLLNDETNRKMIIQSVQEAANLAYKEQEKMSDEYSEKPQESTDDNERY